MSLRRDVHLAFDEVVPSTAGISERVVQTVLGEGATRRKTEGMIVRLRAPLSLVATLVLVAMVVGIFVAGRLVQDWNAFHNGAPAGKAHQPTLAQL